MTTCINRVVFFIAILFVAFALTSGNEYTSFHDYFNYYILSIIVDNVIVSL
jgi:fumarate reductase subunit C